MKKKSGKPLKSKKAAKTPQNQLRERILIFFQLNSTKKFTAFQIAKKLKVKDIRFLLEQLDTLVEKKQIKHSANQKYAALSSTASKGDSKSTSKVFSGYVDMARAGFAYIICQDEVHDVYVNQKHLNGAEDGDLVKVELLPGRRVKPDGKIIEIITRSRTQLIGVVRFYNHRAIAFAQAGKKLIEVLVHIPRNIPVEEFDRVVIAITKYKEKSRDLLEGNVIRNLGKETSNDIEMQSILVDKGFPLDWSEALLTAADKISPEISLHSYRKDFRSVTTFTIDPFDAKDFDDALSVQKNKEGQWEIGVHIADVSHYVEEHSALDKEALRRGNSVYLVDRVLPMLPEKLSNNLCSLRPKEDKYTFSVVFTLDDKFNIIGQWIGKTLIHSNHRFTYEEVQEILDGKQGPYQKELHLLNTLATHIRKERMAHGSIDFDSVEVKFKLDAHGNPLELLIKERKPAHMLIEEFMLLANKFVALFIAQKNKEKPIPFVYRIHDKPDPGKLEGLKLDFSSPKKISQSINKISEAAQKNEVFKILQPLAIRSMAKAEYSPHNIGHYGLAFPFYSHFTSPIRRYADLLVHRLLYANLETSYRAEPDLLHRQCLHISNQERKAMEAERASTRYFQVVFLKDRVGELFDGRIIGMNERGFYIELEGSHCEGFLPINQLDNDIEIHKSRFKASSSFITKAWKIGDKLKVKLVAADLDQKELLLSII